MQGSEQYDASEKSETRVGEEKEQREKGHKMGSDAKRERKERSDKKK